MRRPVSAQSPRHHLATSTASTLVLTIVDNLMQLDEKALKILRSHKKPERMQIIQSLAPFPKKSYINIFIYMYGRECLRQASVSPSTSDPKWHCSLIESPHGEVLRCMARLFSAQRTATLTWPKAEVSIPMTLVEAVIRLIRARNPWRKRADASLATKSSHVQPHAHGVAQSALILWIHA